MNLSQSKYLPEATPTRPDLADNSGMSVAIQVLTGDDSYDFPFGDYILHIVAIQVLTGDDSYKNEKRIFVYFYGRNPSTYRRRLLPAISHVA